MNRDESLYYEDGWQVKRCPKSKGRLTIWEVLGCFGFVAGGYAFLVLILTIGNALFN